MAFSSFPLDTLAQPGPTCANSKKRFRAAKQTCTADQKKLKKWSQGCAPAARHKGRQPSCQVTKPGRRAGAQRPRWLQGSFGLKHHLRLSMPDGVGMREEEFTKTSIDRLKRTYDIRPQKVGWFHTDPAPAPIDHMSSQRRTGVLGNVLPDDILLWPCSRPLRTPNGSNQRLKPKQQRWGNLKTRWQIPYCTLHYSTLHHITLHNITSHNKTLRCMMLHTYNLKKKHDYL